MLREATRVDAEHKYCNNLLMFRCRSRNSRKSCTMNMTMKISQLVATLRRTTGKDTTGVSTALTSQARVSYQLKSRLQRTMKIGESVGKISSILNIIRGVPSIKDIRANTE